MCVPVCTCMFQVCFTVQGVSGVISPIPSVHHGGESEPNTGQRKRVQNSTQHRVTKRLQHSSQSNSVLAGVSLGSELLVDPHCYACPPVETLLGNSVCARKRVRWAPGKPMRAREGRPQKSLQRCKITKQKVPWNTLSPPSSSQSSVW